MFPGRRRCERRWRAFWRRPFAPVLDQCDAIHQRILKGRVFVALHMHAGDGNVHTNIPVNSDNYEMLHSAGRAVARIMGVARALGGVISGEHGIGITKLEYLNEGEMQEFRAFKKRIDPHGHFNGGKLLPGADLTRAYTPSFSLLGHESLILQHSDLKAFRTRSRTACAAANASPCAPPTFPVPTCCTRHATRYWLLHCWSRRSCTRNRRAEAFRADTGTRLGISVTIAPCVTSARRLVRWISILARCPW